MAIESGTRRYAANPADLPRGTLVELFFGAIDRYGHDAALQAKVGGEWRSISHRELETRVRRIVLAFRTFGLERGDRIAILSENRPEWAMVDYATLCFGGLDVPIYSTLPANQIAFILKDSGTRLICVSTADQLGKILEVRDELPALERIIVFDEVEATHPDVMTLDQVLDLGAREEAAGKGADFRERALQAMPDDLATLIYTSGTTGQPKGVMLTHNNLYSNTRAVEDVLTVGPDDVALSFLPLSHVFQRMVDYYLFGHGVTIAYVSSFDLVPQSLVEVRPTVVVSTPRVYEKLYARVMSATGLRRRLVLWARNVGRRWADAKLAGRRPGLTTRLQHAIADRLVFSKIRERIGGRLRFFVSGAAPLNSEVAKFFYAARITILEGYGLTETSPVTNVNTPEAFRIGTVGKPVAGTEIMIADDGEILVRGPQVMKGYFNNPEATREAIDEDGWFHTGDVGVMDEEGFLRITDRKKDLIVTAGGKNIAPQPIENQVKASRFVAEAVMLGDRRPYPILLVVPSFDDVLRWARSEGITETDRHVLIGDPRVQSMIEAEVNRKLEGLARYELPKKIALLPEEFSIERGELTPTLKVRRRVVEDHYRQVIESLYGQEAEVVAES